MNETARIAQRMVRGAKFLVKHWLNNPNASEKAFTIIAATHEGIDYYGAYKVRVTAVQDSTGIQWIGRLEIMPGSGTIFADMVTIGNLDSFRHEAVLVT
jgi:hypothetical protein